MMSRLLTIVAFVTAAAFGASAQQGRDVSIPVATVTGSAEISGTVVTAGETPAPVRRATVTLKGEQSVTPLHAVTDDRGSFVFRGVAVDRYTITVAKAAFLTTAYGSKRSGGSGTPIVVTGGGRTSVTISLVRGAAISGTVRDEQGRPVPDVTVSLLRERVLALTGTRALDSVTVGSSGYAANNYALDAFPGTAVTDDRGHYRIYGLPAGEYVVSATVRPPVRSPLESNDLHQVSNADIQRAMQLLRGPGQPGGAGVATPAVAVAAAGATTTPGSSRVDYVPVYHPAAISRQDAARVAIAAAEDRDGIDVTVRLVPTARVSGYITATDGTPVTGAQVSVMNPDSASGGAGRTTRSGFDGEFVIDGVPPGRYEVQAAAYPSGLFGTTMITVNGQDVETSFQLEPGVTLSGRVVYDGKAKVPATPIFPFLRRERWTIGGGGGEALPDHSFRILRLVPGRYTLAINGRPPAGWILRSVVVNGVDVTDGWFEIRRGENVENVVVTLTDRPAEISGVLQDAAGKPAPEYVLIVFPSDPKRWLASRRTQQVRPDINGRFIARDLPAGEYLIAAVTDIEDGQWNDPDFLAALAAASPIKVTVAEGDRKVQDIRVAGR